MTEAHWVCNICGNTQVVVPDGRGHPPDIAKRKLKKKCKHLEINMRYVPKLVVGPPPSGQETWFGTEST